MTARRRARRSVGPCVDARTQVLADLLVYPQFDLLDLGGPCEVLLTANRLATRHGQPPPFVVRTLSHDGAAVRAEGGLVVKPDHAVAVVDDPAGVPDGVPAGVPDGVPAGVPDGGVQEPAEERCRILIVPGAVDLDAVLGDGTTLPALKHLSRDATLIASVCTGSVLLGAAGLLDGVVAATTHHEDLDLLIHYLDPERVLRGVRWVDAGRVVTAAGLANGLFMAVHLVDRIAGPELARAVASNLALPWSPGDGVTVV